MKKLFTLLLCCSSLVPVALFAQKREYDSLIAKESHGDSDAAYQLHLLAFENKLYNNNEENRAASQRYLFRAAELGNIAARYQVAKSYLGEGTTVSIKSGQKTAYSYLLDISTKPVGRNYTMSQFFDVNELLGECHEWGKGVTPNISQAFRYYLFSSLANENAHFALGRIFLRGSENAGIKADLNAAIQEFYYVYLMNEAKLPEIVQQLRQAGKIDDFLKFLEQNADAGDGMAAYAIAENSFSGTYFPKEITKALKYYQLAVDYGNYNAAVKLGDILAYGSNFVPVDTERAVQLYSRAAYNASNSQIAHLAGRRLLDLAKKNDKVTPQEIFKCLMLAGDYKEARKTIQSNDLDWSAQDIYLKAKEYSQNRSKSSFDRAEYRERLHMASNAGYPLAVQDYLKEFGMREYNRVITALEAEPRPYDPEWLYILSVCYRSGGSQNPSRNYKKSLELMIKAAELGQVNSMDLLIRLYSAGAAHYGVPEAKPELVKKYTDMILRYDAHLRYPNYFSAYLKNLKERKDSDSLENITYAVRSLGYSADAAMVLYDFYINGNENLKIEKNEMFAFVMLHVAAMHGHVPAMNEISKLYTYGLPGVVSIDKTFSSKYSSIRDDFSNYVKQEKRRNNGGVSQNVSARIPQP